MRSIGFASLGGLFTLGVYNYRVYNIAQSVNFSSLNQLNPKNPITVSASEAVNYLTKTSSS